MQQTVYERLQMCEVAEEFNKYLETLKRFSCRWSC